jgi:hypothetical protein
MITIFKNTSVFYLFKKTPFAIFIAHHQLISQDAHTTNKIKSNWFN